jgi:hypothetical protein
MKIKSLPAATGLLALIVLLLVLLQLYHLFLFGAGIDYQKFGDVATWFAGLMTFGAVAVALRESYRSGIRERAERERMVTAVIPWLEMGGASWLMRVDNQTGRVIEAWSLALPENGLHLCWRDAGPCPPGLTTFSLERIRNLPPLLSSNFPSYQFTFIDADERVWVRDVSGNLTPLRIDASEFRSHACAAANERQGHA